MAHLRLEKPKSMVGKQLREDNRTGSNGICRMLFFDGGY
jgi:hypothetical protein